MVNQFLHCVSKVSTFRISVINCLSQQQVSPSNGYFLNSARRPTCQMSVILLERAKWRADIITFEIIALFVNPGEINLSYYKLIFDQPSDYLDTATQLFIFNNLVISVFQTQGIEIPKQRKGFFLQSNLVGLCTLGDQILGLINFADGLVTVTFFCE